MSERETKRLTVVVERWLACRVKALAAIEGKTLSQCVEEILEDATEMMIPFQDKARKEWGWRIAKRQEVSELERIYEAGAGEPERK
jgi:hypothetical protein